MTGKASLPSYWEAINEKGEAISAQDRPAQMALRTGQKQSSQIIGVSQPQSEVRWIQIKSTPFFVDDSAQPTHSVTTFNDISELKKTQKILERNEADLQRILDGVPAMIGHWSRDLLNLQANKAYLEYFGQTPAEMRGKHIKSLLGPEVFAKNLPYITAALEGKKQTFERELVLPDGSSRHTLATYLPVVQDGVPDGFFVIVTDISQVKNLEIQRREMEGKMIESSRMSILGEMAGGIAHEVNNPLTIIKGKAMQLRKNLEANNNRDDLLKGLTVIENTVDRISKTIRGLRAFSRNAENDPFVETDVATLIEDTLILGHERFKHSEIDVQISIQENVKFSCRPTQISQVLMNLLDNAHYAVKFLPEKWVKIAASIPASGSNFQISVTDSGRGVPENVIGKMMQPFFTTKEVGAGTGLGLSISKGIIESHGGTLLYDRSSPNTCFLIDLPRTQPGGNS